MTQDEKLIKKLNLFMNVVIRYTVGNNDRVINLYELFPHYQFIMSNQTAINVCYLHSEAPILQSV